MKGSFIFATLISVFSLNYYVSGQTGGTSTYDFLNLTNSARVASLGGKNISLNDNDLNLAFHNPSLLTPAEDQDLVLNYVAYFADINYGYASYAKDFNKLGTFAVGIHYIDYGKFIKALPTGEITGQFYGAEYALNLIYARPIDSTLRFGVNLKPLYSVLEHYNSFGIAMDAGLNYSFEDGLSSASVVFRNMGFQITSYTGLYREPLPFEILIGISKKFEYAPFRISITAHDLQKYNLLYTLASDSASDGTTTSNPTQLSKFTDNFFRHLIFAVEFLPTKSFYASIAYDYKKRQEMKLQDYGGSVGFSFGFGLRLKRFSLAYGYSVLHAAGGSNHFSFTINLGQFYNH